MFPFDDIIMMTGMRSRRQMESSLQNICQHLNDTLYHIFQRFAYFASTHNHKSVMYYFIASDYICFYNRLIS